MRKLVLTGVLAAAAAAFGGLKVGTVDMMLLVRSHPSYDTNKSALMTKEKDCQREVDALKAKLDAIQAEGKKLAEEYRNPMLAQAAKTKIEGELDGVQKKYMEAQQDLRAKAMQNQQELSELESRLLKAQADDLKKRISEFAAKNGYDLVVDAAAALYVRKGLDVTDEVLKSMNVDPKKARADKEKNEGK